MTPRGSPRGVVCSQGRPLGRLSPGARGAARRRGLEKGTGGGMRLAGTLGRSRASFAPSRFGGISPRPPSRCWDGTSPSSLAGGEAGSHPGRGTQRSRPGRGGPAVSSRCRDDQPGKFPSKLASPRPAPGTQNEVNPLTENAAPAAAGLQRRQTQPGLGKPGRLRGAGPVSGACLHSSQQRLSLQGESHADRQPFPLHTAIWEHLLLSAPFF